MERAAVSGQSHCGYWNWNGQSGFLEPCSRVFILAGANPGELTLGQILDPDEDSDYEPTSDEDSEEDELEFDSGSEASVSSDEEVVVSE